MAPKNIVSARTRARRRPATSSAAATRKRPATARPRPKAASAPDAPTAKLSAADAPGAGAKLTTREQLLETAGQVFSEKGYAGATGKEICERCGANVAAVVYHFGGMENLYRAVLHAARSRLAPTEALAAAVAEETDPKRKLRAFIGIFARALAGPVSHTWAIRLMSREIVSPTPIFEEIRNKEMPARAAILRGIVCELTGLPEEHPAVARSCINIMAPLGMLLLISPQRAEKTFPVLSFGPESMEDFTRHMLEFALGGLAAIAR